MHQMSKSRSEGLYTELSDELKDRVSERRLRHIEGVEETCAKLAREYGQDEDLARLAGMLHDWDKGYSDDEARDAAKRLGIDAEIGEWTMEYLPQVLHGPTAAAELHRRFPEIPDAVISAIKKHTTASTEMSDLDMIVYVADAIEPGRKFDEAEHLRRLIGKVSLEELYFEVYRFWTLAIIERGGILHPDTLRIYNGLARRMKPGKPGKGKKKRRKANG